jgi:hypothetical protein
MWSLISSYAAAAVENLGLNEQSAENEDKTSDAGEGNASSAAFVDPDSSLVIIASADEKVENSQEKQSEENANTSTSSSSGLIGDLWGVMKDFTNSLAEENKEVIQAISTNSLLTTQKETGSKNTDSTGNESGNSEANVDDIINAFQQTIEASLGAVSELSITKNISEVASSAFGYFGSILEEVADPAAKKPPSDEVIIPPLPSPEEHKNLSTRDYKFKLIKHTESTYTSDPSGTIESEALLPFEKYRASFRISDYTERLKEVLQSDPVVKAFHEKLVLLGSVSEDQYWLRFFYRVELLDAEERVRKQLLDGTKVSQNQPEEKANLDWGEVAEEESDQQQQEDASKSPSKTASSSWVDLGKVDEANAAESKTSPTKSEDKDVTETSKSPAVSTSEQKEPLSPNQDDGWDAWE